VRQLGQRAVVGIIVFGLACRAEAATRAPAGPRWIWWEAETPQATNFPPDNPFTPATAAARAALSGGKWIGASDPGETLFLSYEIDVGLGSTYELYARKFWLHGPFRWRFDDQPWHSCGRDVALLDDVVLGPYLNANWVDLGAVRLTAGKHSFRVELAETSGGAAFDCFLLVDGPFDPHGKLKPGEKYGRAPDGWFAFEPEPDSGGAGPLDLRGLNEKLAGDGGFIQARGDSFIHLKTGQPVRFWAVNLGHEMLNHTQAALDRLARHLAGLGVNMVRLHGPLWREDDPSQVDLAKLSKIHRLVAALARQGIYLALSSYYPLWLQPKNQPGLEGFDGKTDAFAVMFFNPRLQAMQRGWWKTTLTTVNPLTGLALRDDPTLGFIEVQNEDSLLFWTFVPYEKIPAPQMLLLERAFGSWLTSRYGGIDRALSTWGAGAFVARLTGKSVRGDVPAEGRAGLLAMGEVLRRHDARARDTVEFLAGLQRRYYDEARAYLRKDLGFKAAVSGSNWITADARVLGPLDKWSNAGCDFIDRHGYFAGSHEGPRAGFQLSAGDHYNDASALLFETGKGGEKSFDLPIMDLGYDGKPSTISEVNWTPPNRYRAEMPVLAAAYGALQGTDAFFFFASGAIGWDEHLTKFSISDPAVMGQFPATALMFRKGLVGTGAVVNQTEAKLSDLYALTGIRAPDPLAFLAGRVQVNVTESGGASKSADLSSYVDRAKQVVRSTTGELAWDYGRGLVTIDAPSAQGATGFLARAGTIRTAGLTMTSPLDYGSILLVSMDDQPLAASRKMLLQIMSEDENFGWSAPGSGLRPIVDVGGPPIVVRRFAGEVSLTRSDAASLRVTPLDWGGRPNRAAPAFRDARQIRLAPTTIYYLLEK
jgi:hypothetical protein